MNIYYSEDNAMHWLEIDNSTIRIPFNCEPEMGNFSNVYLLFNDLVCGVLWDAKAIQFRELWNNRDNKNDKV